MGSAGACRENEIVGHEDFKKLYICKSMIINMAFGEYKNKIWNEKYINIFLYIFFVSYVLIISDKMHIS